MSWWTRWTETWRSVADTLLPRHCPVCDRPLEQTGDMVCAACMARLPLTHYEDIKFNPMEQLFAGKVRVERAAGWYYYDKGSPFVGIIHDAKYRNVPELGQWMGSRAFDAMRGSGFFDGIEAVIPVPLHFTKRAARGYNQTEYLARGIAGRLGCPVVRALKARAHSTQTAKDAKARWENTRDAFALDPSRASAIEGRHVLLVDDVVTTGSTLEVCARALSQVAGVRVSLFTLACARLS